MGIMRSVVLCLLAALAGACGTTGHGSLDVEVSVGGETVERGGRTTRAGSQATGGTAGVVIDGGAGGEGGNVVTGGEPQVTAGQPATTGGEPSVDGGAGGVSGDAGSPGGDGGSLGGGAAGEPSTGGQPPVVEPWKVCQDGEICAADEVCVYDSDTHRICSKIDDEFDRCDPYATPSPELLSYCQNQQIACSQPYRLCNWLSADARGTRCPTTSDDGEPGIRWYCGPPAP